MQLIISQRGVVLTPALKALLERKVSKLTRVLPKLIDARVVCEAQRFQRRVRFTLRAKRRTFAAVATAPHLVAAVDEAVDTLGRQVRRDKARRRALRHSGSRRVA